MFLNHYDILGVPEDAELVQIIAAWKRLMKKYHPDLNQDDEDAPEQAKIVNASYAVLSDSKQRKEFDLLLAKRRQEEDESDNNDEESESESPNETHQESEFSSFERGTQEKGSYNHRRNNSYSSWMTVIGIFLGAVTAVPIGIFLVWAISGFDPLGIFREKDRIASVDSEGNSTETKNNGDQPEGSKSEDSLKKGVESGAKKTSEDSKANLLKKKDVGLLKENSTSPKKDKGESGKPGYVTKHDPVANPKKTIDPTFTTPFTVAEIIVPEPKAVPVAAQVANAKSKIAALFKDEYDQAKKAKGATMLKELKVVSEGILKKLAESKDDVTTFALFEIAIDVTRESCFAEETLKLVENFEKQFAVDGMAIRLEVFDYWLVQIPKLVKDRKERQEAFARMSVLVNPFIQKTIRENNWATANRLAEINRRYAVGAGQRDQGIELGKIASTMSKLVNEETQALRYLEDLAGNPNQPDKNLYVGKYFCFSIEDWERGLPFLKSSGNELLSKCATTDMESTIDNYVAAADQWWKLLEQESDKDVKSAMAGRADIYYRLAFPFSTGVEKVRLAKRIDEARGFRRAIVLGAKKPATKESPTTGMKFVRIYGGSFKMGETQFNIREFGGHAREYRHEGPQHDVTISRAFYIGKFEVMQKEWKQVMGTKPWTGLINTRDGDRVVASCIKWGDAVEFCKRLSKTEGRKYRLPTEAEWELACRAGTQDRFHWGRPNAGFYEYGWCRENAWNAKGHRFAHPVGLKKPNPWGLYDIHGNVLEWCMDRYTRAYYGASPRIDPLNTTISAEARIMRGGAFYYPAHKGRSASRRAYPPNEWHDFGGFRVVLEE